MKGLRGFTLVELMVVIAIISVLLALSVPLGAIINKTRATTNSHEFAATLNTARSTAITQGSDVVICRPTIVDPATNEQDCLISPGPDIYWQDGWVIFVDTNGDGSITNGTIGGPDANGDGRADSLDDDDQIIAVHRGLPTGYTLRNNDGEANPSKSRVIFSSTGLANGSQDTWILCPPSNEARLAIAISLALTGRVTFAEDTDGDGVRDIGVGEEVRPLTCPA